jgi:hypothetical protein
MNTSALNVSARAAGSPRSFSATSVPFDMCLKLAGAHIPKWSLAGIRRYPGRTSALWRADLTTRQAGLAESTTSPVELVTSADR